MKLSRFEQKQAIKQMKELTPKLKKINVKKLLDKNSEYTKDEVIEKVLVLGRSMVLFQIGLALIAKQNPSLIDGLENLDK